MFISGLIINMGFWDKVKQIKQRLGKISADYGCVVAMLVAQAIVIGLFCLLVIFTSLIGWH